MGITLGNLVGGSICGLPPRADGTEGWKIYLYLSGISQLTQPHTAYVFLASVNGVALLMWIVLVTDTPEIHPWVSIEEENLIRSSSTRNTDPPSKSLKVLLSV